MKKLLLICVLSLVSKGYSQDTIVNFLDAKGNSTSRDKAFLIQILVKKDTALLESLYSNSNRKLISTGHYLDDKLKTKIGQFQYHDRDGELRLIESFNNTGVLHGKYLSFKNKNKQTIGVYNNGKRHGVWNFYDENGGKQARIIYKDDEVYSYDLWDKEGNKKDEPLIIERKPEFPGGEDAFQKEVVKGLVKKLNLSTLSGRILVVFTINEEGNIENLRTNQTLSTKNKVAFESVFYDMPKWSPGIRLNRNIKMNYTMPIKLQ